MIGPKDLTDKISANRLSNVIEENPKTFAYAGLP